jgi:hypothetical protein
MIHKMVSVLPPPFAASIPITPSMSPPFILGNYRRGAARSLTQQGRRAATSPRQVARLLPSRFRCLLPGGRHHSIGDTQRSWTTSGSSAPHLKDLVEPCPSGFREFRSRRGWTTTHQPLISGETPADKASHRYISIRSVR